MHAVRLGLQAFTSKARFDMHVRDGLRLAHGTAARRERGCCVVSRTRPVDQQGYGCALP